MLANILEPENKLLYLRKSEITDNNELVILCTFNFVSFLLWRTTTQNNQNEMIGQQSLSIPFCTVHKVLIYNIFEHLRTCFPIEREPRL